VYTPDERVQMPDFSTPIWRYLTLPGLLSILQQRKLFFPAVWRMKDPYDANLPKSVKRQYLEWYGLSSEDQPEPRKITSDSIQLRVRGGTCISCWHCSSTESAAMWSLYSLHHGVAIRSTVGRLVQALQATPREISIGMVRYVDFSRPNEDDAWLWLRPEFVKRTSFEYERELRAVTLDFDVQKRKGGPNELTGVAVEVDATALIERVYLSPVAESWIKDVIELELPLHGLAAVEVKHSTMFSDDLG